VPAGTAHACTPGPGFRCWPPTTHHRRSSFADPPQRCHRGIGLPTLRPPTPGPVAHAGGRGWPALAHRGIVPEGQRPGRNRPAPGPTLALLASLDHPGHARPRFPGRGHRDRTRYRIHTDRPDRVDRQRVSTTLRRPTTDRQTHPEQPAGLVTMATTTPIPGPAIPLPTTGKPMTRSTAAVLAAPRPPVRCRMTPP
jgi:hypothetical protein